MNTVQKKIAQIKELGLVISDDNRSSDGGYELGSVPAGTESLDKVEFNVCFQVTEDFYDHLTSDYYHSLHELAEGNSTQAFIEYLNALHNQYGGDSSDTVFRRMADEVQSYMTDIENELDEVILSLGGDI